MGGYKNKTIIFDQKTSDSLASRESLLRAQENIKDVVDELEMLIRSNWQSTQSTLNPAK